MQKPNRALVHKAFHNWKRLSGTRGILKRQWRTMMRELIVEEQAEGRESRKYMKETYGYG